MIYKVAICDDEINQCAVLELSCKIKCDKG